MMFAEVLGRAERAARCGFLVALLALAVPGQVLGDNSITLAWDPSADTTVAGYNVYYGVASGSYTNTLKVGTNTSATVSGLVAGVTYYFAATSYTADGLESDYSAEASYAVPPLGNQPPTLNQPANLTLNENAGPQNVPLSGISSGYSSEVQVLSVSAFSDTPTLIPTPAVIYSSPGSNGTLAFTPAANSFGTATITVMVDDGGVSNNTVIRAFTVTVNPVYNPPTITALSNLTLAENAGMQTVNLDGISAGLNNPAQTLTVTATSSNPALVPNPAVDYTSPNATGALTFTPATNAAGSARITVTVDNGQPANNQVTSFFTVTITSTNSPAAGNWTLWWQNTNGWAAVWQMLGTNATQTTRVDSGPAAAGWTVAGTADFDGNGSKDILFQSTGGWVGLWLMDGTNVTGHMRLNSVAADPGWNIVGTGDFDGNGSPDILWQSTSGWVGLWQMDGTNVIGHTRLNSTPVDAGWKIVGTGDFDGDGHTDILWQSTSGWVALWLMDGTNFIRSVHVNSTPVAPGWSVVGTADVDGDGQLDIVWRHQNGTLAYWLLSGTTCRQTGRLNPAWVDPAWRTVGPR